MPGRDWRTVGDLLADTDALARETLLDVSPAAGPAMLRTFAQVVQSAARLSSALPPSTLAPPLEPDVMVRLQAVGRGIGRSVSVSRWPGPGPVDERLCEMAHNLNRAAVLVERNGRHVQPTTPQTRADIAAAQSRVVHAVYVAAHATAVAVTAYVHDLRERLDTATRRHTPLAERPNLKSVPAATAYLDRLDVFEQLAGIYVASHPVALAALGEVNPLPPGTRLESVLARWDIQAHRTLASHPEPADLLRVARTQALITTVAEVITSAAADQGVVDRALVQRLAPTLQATQVAWTLTANLWSGVRSPNGHADPALVRTASDVRTAVAATATTPTGWASPEQLADQLDLGRTVRTLHLGMVASVDVAYVMREVAAISQGLTRQPQATTGNGLGPTQFALDRSDTPQEGKVRAPAQANHQSTPQESLRRGLVNLADDVIATANKAVAGGTPLQHGQPEQASHSARQPDPRRRQEERATVIKRAPEGPRR